MSNKLSVVFLWHMHQPYYFGISYDNYVMPWVRLHATKAYYDMVRMAEDYDVKLNFNFVPSLIKQLNLYLEGEQDTFLKYSYIEPKLLQDDQKLFILRYFFQGNWDTMIKPYTRYWELLAKTSFQREYDIHVARRFSPQDYLDLVVWFNLTWFGHKAREDFPFIRELIEKGERFTYEESMKVLDLQRQVISLVLEKYKKLYKENKIDIATSPFYHPILPIVIDSEIAKRSQPSIQLPERFAYPDDAYKQVVLAMDYHKKSFGKVPKGMWPSEGSVCPEEIELLADNGIKWILTDEAILFESVNKMGYGEYKREDVLYKPYTCEINNKKVDILFRDVFLSNRLSFDYSKMPGDKAANELLHYLYEIQKAHPGGVVSIVLDGENPWEYFPDGGKQFLEILYGTLENNDKLEAVTITDYLNSVEKVKLNYLHSGSWIDSNFRIWIGHREKNKAWECLREARAVAEEYFKQSDDKELKAEIMDMLYVCEGSDWFWWYGEDFSSQNDAKFDWLFRNRLLEVYRKLGREAPWSLRTSIGSYGYIKATREPLSFIDPLIDGEDTNYMEWYGAGFYDLTNVGGAMYRPWRIIKSIYYGFNLDYLFIRLDPMPRALDARYTFYVYFSSPHEVVFRVNLLEKKLWFKKIKGQWQEVASDKYEFKLGKIIELALSFEQIGVKSGEKLEFSASLFDGQYQLERYPIVGYLSFEVPDPYFEEKAWLV